MSTILAAKAAQFVTAHSFVHVLEFGLPPSMNNGHGSPSPPPPPAPGRAPGRAGMTRGKSEDI